MLERNVRHAGKILSRGSIASARQSSTTVEKDAFSLCALFRRRFRSGCGALARYSSKDIRAAGAAAEPNKYA